VTLLFVYGTLKRGCSNHAQMAGAAFVGEALTVPGFTLIEIAEYPGMVARPGAADGVRGEVWSVDDVGLARLDAFEGTAEGVFAREAVALQEPFGGRAVEAYLYLRDVNGRRELGALWTE
jgi:gamma-glutamylaminecyclotransferase